MPWRTIEGEDAPADRRIGVVWHTQGSGKSLSMAFYAGKIIKHPAMENPTLVVITDRNDLDDQLFGTFARCSELLRQKPVQAESREHLKELLTRWRPAAWSSRRCRSFPEGGTATPERPAQHRGDRRRGPPQPLAYDFIDGFAAPHAGRPAERVVHRLHRHAHRTDDKNTPAVFGDYIDKYDIQRRSRTGRRCRSTTRAAWRSWKLKRG
jgi:type I restriction enzyme, R subunit